jgi:antitoxin component YwqK of YwqJK toxin-antitoxin module|tara:strand:+ start:6487 stop:6999 length:513 start_codon:yes stop_codon:yes gene_type:complete
MKKAIQFFIIVFVCTTSFSQEIEKDYYDNGQLESVYYYDSEGNKTGEWKDYYSNGQLLSVRKFSNDVLLYETEYFENGQLKYKGAYELNMRKVGEWKYYFENGQLKLIGVHKYNYSLSSFENEHRIGEWKEYYDNGQLESIGSYDADGKKLDDWKYYDEKGKVKKDKYDY